MEAFNYILLANGDFNGKILDNELRHLAISRAGTLLSFYVDGQLIGTRISSLVSNIGLDQPLWIGKDRSTDQAFQGNIFQVRIWEEALSEATINDNLDADLAGNTPGLLTLWRLEEAGGQSINDETGDYQGQLGNSLGNDTFDPQWSNDECKLSQEEEYNLSLFPNPTLNEFVIEQATANPLEVILFDMLGRWISTQQFNSSRATVDLRNYASGVYVVEVRNLADQKILIQRVVKQ